MPALLGGLGLLGAQLVREATTPVRPPPSSHTLRVISADPPRPLPESARSTFNSRRTDAIDRPEPRGERKDSERGGLAERSERQFERRDGDEDNDDDWKPGKRRKHEKDKKRGKRKGRGHKKDD